MGARQLNGQYGSFNRFVVAFHKKLLYVYD